jgi:predicted ABC-type transport system involved in lysophospholipase L1 biosynthesis ATPase subunit
MPTGRSHSEALCAHGLRAVLGGRAVLDHVDLSLDEGSSVAVVGPSGSGKTTLLMLLAGITRPSAGALSVAGRDLVSSSDRDRAAVRLTEIGVVYQFGELLPELTPVENVALPALMAGMGRDEGFTRAAALLEDLAVDGAVDVPTSALSGGERQRVAVARALVNRPSLLLADEPTGSLDGDTTEIVADLLYSLPGDRSCAMVVVTHNERVAARADRVLELRAGCLVEVAPC